MTREYSVLSPRHLMGVLTWAHAPIILVGADGTGKSTLCNATRMRTFHYTRGNAKEWLAGNAAWALKMNQYDLFDRHPVIDWPVYEYAFGNMTREQMAEWLTRPHVIAELSGKTVLWLTHRFVEPSIERGDLPEAVEHAGNVANAYRLFFRLMVESPTLFNVHVIEEGSYDEFDE